MEMTLSALQLSQISRPDFIENDSGYPNPKELLS